VIKQGLAAGDVIVVQGAYVLKARLLKSQLGEGHAD
jgi:cobalt-zinc-cadmium efflux system membrane fusion protein